jgi:2-dehydro-3-deoxy-D-arabinonate dehydratase
VEPAPRRPHLIAPIDAPEIWGAGITYRRSADYYTPHQGRAKGIYDHVYESKRPELFFKATMSRAVGPNGTICVRRDSSLTAAEPELALVMGPGGGIVAYAPATTSRRGTSSARTRRSCRSPRCSGAASRSGRCW